MTDFVFEKRLAALDNAASIATLRDIRRGIEKESLRVDRQGTLAQTPHPAPLGSALGHPYITTDYSEALLELITPAEKNPAAPIDWLNRLHRYVYQTLADQNELIWNTSMPCPIGKDGDIPVAEYGSSNPGRMKRIYRLGLGHRYGRRMQTIAGIHYNFSFPQQFWELYQPLLKNQQPLQDFISERYFGLLRNFQRNAWLIIYLFGASPAMCSSFLEDTPNQLLERFDNTLSRPHATSLRMSDFGYQNNAQSALQISVDDLQSYVETLTYAINTPDPAYAQMGVRTQKGLYRQLNANILQIENEFYSSIRPKRNTLANERPTLALKRRGVEYIEMRALDINPLLPVGIDEDTCHFLDLFATYCLLMPSPKFSYCDINATKQNIRQVVYDGRRPALTLWRQNNSTPLKNWAGDICRDMQGIAALFDSAYGDNRYQQSLDKQRAKLDDPNLTPSAQVLHAIKQSGSFFDFSLQQAEKTQQHFLQTPPDDADSALFAKAAKDSLTQKAELEADSTSFEDYLAEYFQGTS